MKPLIISQDFLYYEEGGSDKYYGTIIYQDLDSQDKDGHFIEHFAVLYGRRGAFPAFQLKKTGNHKTLLDACSKTISSKEAKGYKEGVGRSMPAESFIAATRRRCKEISTDVLSNLIASRSGEGVSQRFTVECVKDNSAGWFVPGFQYEAFEKGGKLVIVMDDGLEIHAEDAEFKKTLI